MARIITMPAPTKKGFDSKSLLLQLATFSPHKSFDYLEGKKRRRIQDAIEAAMPDGIMPGSPPIEIVLESAEYDLLREIVKTFPYNVYTDEHDQIVDAVLEARKVDLTPKKTAETGAKA
jgi:hypothetical protein